MWKKFFASILAILGTAIAFACGSVSAISSWTAYTAGTAVSMPTGSIDVCVNKTSGYAGDDIIADIDNGTFETQLVFEAFNGNSSCKTVNDIDTGATIRYIVPMGYSGLKYGYDSSSIALNLDDATLQSKYLKASGTTSVRVAASKVQVSFDANGGTGITSVLPVANLNTNITLPANTLTKTDYKFDSWNTKADGTGTRYEDGDTVSFAAGGEVALYAQWVVDYAVLAPGINVSQKMKRMAGNASAIYTSTDQNIKAIKAANALPAGFNENDTNYIISASNSPKKIHAWFDNTDGDNDGNGDGVIYVYSAAGTIKGNADMSNVFYRTSNLTDISALSSWNTSSVKNMSSMFYYASNLTNISALSSWNTSSVTDMHEMFRRTKITNTDALETKQYAGNNYTSWDVSSVTDMGGMFRSASSLTDISALSSWNTSSVTDMERMFEGTIITNTDALETKQYAGNSYTSWDVSSVTDMSYMFYLASSLTDISALSSWNTSSVTSMHEMFRRTKITNTDALETKQYAGNSYTSWDVSSVTDMSSMFGATTNLTDISALSSWNTSSVTSMNSMFHYTSIADTDALETKQYAGNSYTSWDVSSVTDMGGMFGSASSLTDISALSSWNTSSATSMIGMFSYDSSLADISALSSWNTSSVTNMSEMFRGTKIANTDALETKQYAGNSYTSWDVSSVTDMSSMFYDASRLTDITALSSWNTANVTNMSEMFRGARSVASFSALDGWTLNASLDKTDMFKNVSSTAILPSWY